MYPITHLQQLLIHGQMFHIYPYPLSTHSCGLLDTNSRYFIISSRYCIISYRCISLKDKDLNKLLQFCYHTKKINSNSFLPPAVSIILYLQSAVNTGNVFSFCFFFFNSQVSRRTQAASSFAKETQRDQQTQPSNSFNSIKNPVSTLIMSFIHIYFSSVCLNWDANKCTVLICLLRLSISFCLFCFVIFLLQKLSCQCCRVSFRPNFADCIPVVSFNMFLCPAFL